MHTSKMVDNAHKVTYLAKCYPEKNLEELIALLSLPSVFINTAIWCAQDMGFLSEVKDGRVELLKEPDAWEFGPELLELEQNIVFAFQTLAKKRGGFRRGIFTRLALRHPEPRHVGSNETPD